MRTVALYTRAVNIVKKKYVLCKILFCARIITRAAHSVRGKKKRLQSKLQPKLLLKYFFVFHNEASDINIVSRGDAADNLQRGYNKPNNCSRFFIYNQNIMFACFEIIASSNSRIRQNNFWQRALQAKKKSTSEEVLLIFRLLPYSI